MGMNKGKKIQVKVARGTVGEERIDNFQVPVEPGQSVLLVLQYIRDHFDPTLGLTFSCRIGLCTACLVRINGKVVRSCTTLVEEDIYVEPYKEEKQIRDLIADLPPII